MKALQIATGLGNASMYLTELAALSASSQYKICDRGQASNYIQENPN